MKLVKEPLLFFLTLPFVIIGHFIAVHIIIEMGIGFLSIPQSAVLFLLFGVFTVIVIFLFRITRGVFFSSEYHLVSKILMVLMILFVTSIPYIFQAMLEVFDALEIYRYRTNTSLESYEETIVQSQDGTVERVDFSFAIHMPSDYVDEAIVHFDHDSKYVVARMKCLSSKTPRPEHIIDYWSWDVLSKAVLHAASTSLSIVTTTSNSGISGVIPFSGNYLSCRGGYMFFKPTRISDQNESLPIRVNPILSLEVVKQHYIPWEGMLNNFVFIPLVTDNQYEKVYNHSDVHIYEDYYVVDRILKEMHKQ